MRTMALAVNRWLFRLTRPLAAFALLAVAAIAAPAVAADPDFELKAGDHICIIGNTLAERMQHDGWLETRLQGRFPDHNLVIRNLGFSGDELDLRLRSEAFESPDWHLTFHKADVIFAFFGYGESFAGKEGLDAFRGKLNQFVQHTLSQQYNGKSAPRLVLFSPIAHENLKSPHLPDGSANNARLVLYTEVMRDVARDHNVRFVDLFIPSAEMYRGATQPCTINGIHLNERGNELLASTIDRLLFPNGPLAKRDGKAWEQLNAAVRDKNFHWFHRYRTTDGYSVFGGRSHLSFTDGQTNREVMQREMLILDQMTAQRDQRIWSIARGENQLVDDNATDPFIPVKTNKPGAGPDGTHLFLTGEDAIKQMTVAPNLNVSLFASEEQFPELINPVQMSFDTKGRLWVATWPTYPHWKPKEAMNDGLMILEDTNGDGKADVSKMFAKDLHNPTGFEFWNGGVLVACPPDLMFLKDTNGDDQADVRERVVNGLDSADTHHAVNSFVLDPGGALYMQEGTFHHTQVETPYGPVERLANAGAFRYDPRRKKFEVWVSFGFANPHGHAFDRWGQSIMHDGTGAQPYHTTLFSGQVDFPHKHQRPPQVYNQRTRPCPASEFVTGGHFPDDYQGNLLVQNVIGFQGILRYKVEDKSSSFSATELEPMLSSSDPNFRPADLEMAPDGSLYFVDWQNPIIGHMQHNLRDPSRDRKHGRVYRVTYNGRELDRAPQVAGAPLEALLDLLKSSNDRLRYRVRIELSSRPTGEVIAAAKKWIANLDPSDANYEHHLLEGLWLFQQHDTANQPLLERVLTSSDFRARAAATRVLCYWQHHVPNSLELFRQQINDAHPRVRLEAIRALSFYRDPQAAAIAVEMFAHPDDEYLRFVFGETMTTLERRLGPTAKVDANNIAASLWQMLEQGNVPADRQGGIVEMVIKRGGEGELGPVWNAVKSGNRFSPELRKKILAQLADAAATRRVRPSIEANDVVGVLTEAQQSDPEMLSAAIRLATNWQVGESGPMIRKLAQQSASPAVQSVAIAALGDWTDGDSQQVLATLAAAPAPLATRFKAAAALSQSDLAKAAGLAAAAIGESSAADQFDGLIEALLARKGGSEALATAIEQRKISGDLAKRVLRAMYLAGRNDVELSGVVSELAGLSNDPKPPTPEEVEKLVAEVTAKGDAARGERVFRRADLGCVRCHAVSKAGGNIGPELSALGGSSPLDYIITSILDPNKSIKEAYVTKVVSTIDGNTFTGIVLDRSNDELVLKTATGQIARVPTADIEEESNGPSLMPMGVTKILTHDETLDLIRYVAELGKPGPFSVQASPVVQRWKLLKTPPAKLTDAVPAGDVLKAVVQSPAENWGRLYALTHGDTPLEELKTPGQKRIVYLQGEIQVIQPGPVELQLSTSQPGDWLTAWFDLQPAKVGATTANLQPGRHTVTVRAIVTDSTTATLRAEFKKPAGSAAQIELVHGE